MAAGLLRAVRGRAQACLRAACLGALLLAARGGAAAEPAPLRLCADPANLPFSSNQPGQPGLYLEIGRAVAAALGRPTETVWSLSNFGKRNLRETLLAGLCDMAVGLPDDADFMGPRLIFSRPILELGYALLTPPGMPVERLADLAGHRVAVQYGTPPQSLLATREDITPVTVLSPEEGVRAIAEGRADMAFLWGPSAGYLNRALLGGADRVTPVAGPGMQWRAAIGFARKQSALRDQVDSALPSVLPGLPALAAKYGWPEGAPITLGAVEQSVSVMVADDAPATPPAAEPAPSGEAVADGKELFNGTCAHCHGPDAVVAERRINLRLLKHRYGDTMEEVFHFTVTHGRAAKGMPNWSGIFSEEDFGKILAFLKTVQQD